MRLGGGGGFARRVAESIATVVPGVYPLCLSHAASVLFTFKTWCLAVVMDMVFFI